jgi:sulfur-carrier protein
MTASIRLPRMLAETVKTEMVYAVEGATLAGALDDLFVQVPGLRNHIVDETGAIRPHVSLFVGGIQADLETIVDEGAAIRVLHAVSGG